MCAYRLEGLGRQEAERIINEQVPPPPSRVVDAGRGAAEGLAERRQLAGDLDAIVLTALQKEPARRYATARGLAEDVDRHLRGEPVTARTGRPGSRVLAASAAPVSCGRRLWPPWPPPSR